MSRLTSVTEKAAITVIEKILPRFGELDRLGMSAEDAFEVRKAENLLRAVVESSPHYKHKK
ncbi:hypothetical protein [Flavobacterium sp.]|uniref:hypothetical protein n=1 Tax=Flavobacterium sp. TaxID=239 RepID=UPI0040332C2A